MVPLTHVTYVDFPDHPQSAREVKLGASVVGRLWRTGSHWTWAQLDELAGDGAVDRAVLDARREDTADVAAYRLLKAVTGADWRELRSALGSATDTRFAA